MILIPKSTAAVKPEHYRPIALSSEIYKMISRVLVNRLKPHLAGLIGINQSAFIPGWNISDNIMLCHDLLHGIHLEHGPPRMCIKIDLRKAFDSVKWDCLLFILQQMNFNDIQISWTKECISNPAFSMMINGTPHGFFQGSVGLRQGDPLSPLLFCMVMESLSRGINRCVADGSILCPLRKGDTTISHLLFADDLMIFGSADLASTIALNKLLDDFCAFSGLSINLNKSQIIFSGSTRERTGICHILGMPQATLPILYLGLPLFSSRLKSSDCSKLLQMVQTRLGSWKSNCLSYAGCLELLKTIINGMHIYWAHSFLLLVAVSNQIERLMRSFLA